MRLSVPLAFGFTRFFLAAVLPGLLSAKTYAVDGIVVAVDVDRRTVIVSHRPVPKLMGAMTMPFQFSDPIELRGLTPGTHIQFVLTIERGHSVAGRIRITGASNLEIPVPRNRKGIGELIPDFALTDQTGNPVRLANLRGKIVAVNFIYTRCPLPDVCPRLSANFALLQRKFSARMGSDLILLSITIDPQFDTREVLSDYSKRWGAVAPGWRFLTGSDAEIQTIAGLFGLVYWPDEGSLGHNSTTSVIGRDGVLAAILEGSSFRPGQLVDVIARQLEATK